MLRSLRFMFRLFILCFVLLGAAGFAAHADVRKALVIGNSTYEQAGSLPNTLNDSKDVAAALAKIGFSVEIKNNLPFDEMRRALRDFSQETVGADIALVYYAGHGMEIGGQNYLLPVDARLRTDRDVAFEAISLQQVMDAVEGAKTLRLVLLDACRNNPFLAKMEGGTKSRAVTRGLASVEPSTGTLVSYAAKEGTTAADGFGRNSPYATALIEHMQEPGLEIRLLFGKVRDTVIDATNKQQEPFVYGSLGGNAVYLVPPVKVIEEPKPKADAPVQEAMATSELDRTKFHIEKRNGSYFARQRGVVVRRSPSQLSGGLAVLIPDTGYAARERLVSKLDEATWFSLETDSGIGFVEADDLLSEKSYQQKQVFAQAIPALDKVWAEADAANKGPFAKYAGVYGKGQANCDGSNPEEQWLVWFKGAAMNIVVLGNPEKVYAGPLKQNRTIKSKSGERIWYAFEGQDMIVSFADDYLAYDPKFSPTKVNFSQSAKCKSAESIKLAVQDEWTSRMERLPTERRQDAN
jgi:Caspase domain